MSETRAFEWDVMLDLETVSTAPNAAIVAIGAWPFRLDDGPVPFRPFYRNVDLESCVQEGLRVDGSFYWWLGQSEEARKRLTEPEPVPLVTALVDLNEWLRRIGGPEHEFRLWAHGTNFDLPILESAWRTNWNVPPPWKYNAARDTRTLFHVAGMDWDAEFEALDGVKHDALEDAREQATLVKRAWAQLKAATND